MQGSGESFALSKDDMPKLREELQKSVTKITDFDKLKDHIEMTVTAEGLRIELMESEAGTFFESGSPAPSASGRDFLIALAAELGKLPNKISIEGHTDSKPFAGKGNYGNWELSADRGPGYADPGVCGSKTSQIRYSGGRFESEDFVNRPVQYQGSRQVETYLTT